MDIENSEGLVYLNKVESNTINLVLTDPPYITSRESGMNTHSNLVKEVELNNINTKTEDDWINYKTESEWNKWFIDNNIDITKKEMKLKTFKSNYLKYGTIYGKKYAVVTNYGEWDKNFTMDILKKFVNNYYRVLKNGGTAIIFFDIWKIGNLKEMMGEAGFKQIRFIEWIKTNPQPLNSSVNYLTNCREVAVCGVKKGKPTFNSKYDNGIYRFPLQGGKNRWHPTQKSLALFEELINKHSNENDIILDTFLGAGTTAFACKNTNRKFKGCEILKEYYDKVIEQI